MKKNAAAFSEDQRKAGPEARRKQSQDFTQRIAHWFEKTAHLSLRETAQVLNDGGVETAKGGL